MTGFRSCEAVNPANINGVWVQIFSMLALYDNSNWKRLKPTRKTILLTLQQLNQLNILGIYLNLTKV
jgi:hypothetical protein